MLTAALIGAGRRGRDIYGGIIKDNCTGLKINAVAEPSIIKRKLTGWQHKIPQKNQFSCYEKMLSKDKLSDALLITTLDHKHYYPTIKGIENGYKILLEKPITPNFEQLKDMAFHVKNKSNEIIITHTLRYTSFYKKIKEIIDKDIIGKIKSINHKENVGYFHFAHSYVRGKWRDETTSAPLFLAKSSHDFDLFTWLLGKRCVEVLARGEQSYFKQENHPANAGKRCLSCSIESDCPYSALHIYLSRDEENPWPKVISRDFPPRPVIKLGIKYTDLGRCVFLCNSTMPEFLEAYLKYEDNINVNFTLNGLSKNMNRITCFYGTKGELKADFEKNKIIINHFKGEKQIIEPPVKAGYHGGGDINMIEDFIDFLYKGSGNKDLTTFEASIESHLTAFAAEKSRLSKKKVSLDFFRTELNNVRGLTAARATS